MNAPGKGILKTVSILFIVFGAIATVFSIIGLAGSAMLTAVAEEAAAAAVGGVLVLAMILAVAVSALELILGIVGLKKVADPSKAQYFIVVGIILCVLSLATTIMNFSVLSLVSFVLPVLYIVGGFMNKKAAA